MSGSGGPSRPVRVPGGVPARYGWPKTDDLACHVRDAGGPRIAVGLLPHANEPLGSAFASTVEGYRGGLGSIALVGPIDPPPPAYRFPLPCDPVSFAARGYLQPTRDQVEFAHCPDPAAPAQFRAAKLRAYLAAVQADVFVLLHNDPRAHAPYLYANRAWPQVERRLTEDVGACFPDWQPLPTEWTHPIGERTYAFFPCERIGVGGTESAGIYIERELGLPTLTVELPMFCWGAAAERARQGYDDALSEWIEAGGTDGGDRPWLVRNVVHVLAGQQVPMVPAAVNSRVVWSVLTGLRDSLAAGRHARTRHAFPAAGEEKRRACAL